jgi:hypothetical protein
VTQTIQSPVGDRTKCSIPKRPVRTISGAGLSAPLPGYCGRPQTLRYPQNLPSCLLRSTTTSPRSPFRWPTRSVTLSRGTQDVEQVHERFKSSLARYCHRDRIRGFVTVTFRGESSATSYPRILMNRPLFVLRMICFSTNR